jgi:CHAD domain-containing protein
VTVTSRSEPIPADLDGRDAALADLVETYLRAQLDALVEGDRVVAVSVDRIYPTRVAARRTRSTLRTFGDLFEPPARRAFDHELQWWASLLGEVRDRSVQIAGLEALAAGLADSVAVEHAVRFVTRALAHQHDAALDAVRRELAGERHAHLHAMIERWYAPVFTARARRDAADVVSYVDSARGRLEAALTSARRPGAAEIDVHDARKAGKRYRYALELAAPRLGEAGVVALARARALQDELGRYQDGVVGLALVGEIAQSQDVPPDVAVGVERLLRALAESSTTARGQALRLDL